MSYKPTVVFDFDGVIHSYKSGWQGPGIVQDPVVPGIGNAINELRGLGYKVVVVSTRCTSPEGMGAVRRYLLDNAIEVDDVATEKPPALCYIDDRAIRFDGHPEELVEQVTNFHTWIEKSIKNDSPVEKLRPCKAIVYENGKKCEVEGRFHRWGDSYEEFETGPGNFTTAIVELNDGKIVSCCAETLQFMDRLQTEAKEHGEGERR